MEQAFASGSSGASTSARSAAQDGILSKFKDEYVTLIAHIRAIETEQLTERQAHYRTRIHAHIASWLRAALGHGFGSWLAAMRLRSRRGGGGIPTSRHRASAGLRESSRGSSTREVARMCSAAMTLAYTRCKLRHCRWAWQRWESSMKLYDGHDDDDDSEEMAREEAIALVAVLREAVASAASSEAQTRAELERVRGEGKGVRGEGVRGLQRLASILERASLRGSVRGCVRIWMRRVSEWRCREAVAMAREEKELMVAELRFHLKSIAEELANVQIAHAADLGASRASEQKLQIKLGQEQHRVAATLRTIQQEHDDQKATLSQNMRELFDKIANEKRVSKKDAQR